MNKNITAYWASLEPRERSVLSWGAVILIAILLYTQLWQPWQHAMGFMKESVRNLRTDSVWMQQRVEDIKGRGAGSSQAPRRGANQSLMAIVEQTAKQARAIQTR